MNGFWLGASLKVSPIEQVQALAQIFSGAGIYTAQETAVVKDMMLEVIWENRHRACGRGMVHRVCAERQPKPLLCIFLERQCLRAGALRR